MLSGDFMLIKDLDNSKQSDNIDSSCFIINGSEAAIVRDKSVLSLIIDEPCLKACEYLYDCNIRTTGSSANGSNFNSKGTIDIDYSSLSAENIEVYKQLVEMELIKAKVEDKDRNDNIVFTLSVPMNKTTTVEEFSRKMEVLAQYFQPQDILYGNYNAEQMLEKMNESLNNNSVTQSGISMNKYLESEIANGNIILEEDGSMDFNQAITIFNEVLFQYYYDSNEEKYWLDESLYFKHKDYIQKKVNTK